MSCSRISLSRLQCQFVDYSAVYGTCTLIYCFLGHLLLPSLHVGRIAHLHQGFQLTVEGNFLTYHLGIEGV